ncbi:DUF424 domain-containing protein [Haloferax sp. Atlit-10N]|uniref:DUF424 domain-containing protein n=1 Tax=Haloferax prahovense (strain DSM 18310 / JCM 13924 / TL6) TaxID=1227461 RepID=M0GSE6_HALPT|nr:MULTISPECIES: DUF424 family protein [Haloferax]ELZ73814.1 hypothetical protein C457_00975 [Haloferax prahovense DSM 18310]RDZ42811.1 DUF424 domain-containing protein [Haloferax sp. Atlit-19N]RDZ43194.1 DUF424 domain-containing protein [Haloferax sp. Atlit-16N]RDZ57768.1 DUF424 domain-containing protein [Haloferax sp. Atlit-10N]
MLLRERETPEGLLVSVCDPDCIGETYTDDGVSLDVTEDFYGGDEAETADEDAVVDSLTRATVANIVGEESVSVAIDAGLVDEEAVLEVGGTLHAQLLWLR